MWIRVFSEFAIRDARMFTRLTTSRMLVEEFAGRVTIAARIVLGALWDRLRISAPV